MAWDSTGLLVPPGSPLINQQADVVLRILLVHDSLVLLDYLLDLQALTQCPVVLIVIEVDGRTLRTVPTGAGVVVQRDTLHAGTNLIHTNLGPVVIIVAGTRCNTIQTVATLIAQVGVELTELVAVVLRAHVTTAAPCLVTNSEVLYLPGFFTSVSTAQTGHWSIAIAGHILNPLCHLLNGTRTYVTRDIRLATQHLAQVQELVGTKRVVLDGATPVVVTQRGAL